MTSHGNAGEFFGPLIAFVWFFAIIDAVRQAKAINRGQLAEAGFAGGEQIKAAAGTGALTWGVILVGLGTLWLIDRYFEIDWSFMEEWGGPAAFILLGLILIVSHVRKRRQENESRSECRRGVSRSARRTADSISRAAVSSQRETRVSRFVFLGDRRELCEVLDEGARGAVEALDLRVRTTR